MSNKIIVALDSSHGAWRAVEYVAKIFGQTPGVEVTLLHVLADPPAVFWDDGHILQENERQARQKIVAQWQLAQEKEWQILANRARERMLAAGLQGKAVTSKFKPKMSDVAEEIIEEATAGGYDTIVMGRRGLGTVKSLLIGSVAQKVMQYARGCAVIVAE
jgi:nucleotide-binding universal stress UspA family protein